MSEIRMNKIVIALLICLPFTAYSQKYVTAGGIRMSKEGIGLSLQQKVFDHTTVEGIVLFNLNETSVGGLLEYHNNLLFTKSLNTYIGAGPVYGKFYNADSSYWGANVVFGLEYKVLLLPFVVSADIKPTVKPGQDDWFNIGMGITFRYVLIKEKRKLFDRDK